MLISMNPNSQLMMTTKWTILCAIYFSLSLSLFLPLLVCVGEGVLKKTNAQVFSSFFSSRSLLFFTCVPCSCHSVLNSNIIHSRPRHRLYFSFDYRLLALYLFPMSSKFIVLILIFLFVFFNNVYQIASSPSEIDSLFEFLSSRL